MNTENMVEAEVSQELADFLKVERVEACAILTYLASTPAMWKELLAVAELHLRLPTPIHPYQEAAQERRRVNAFLRMARFGHCERCFFPVVHYPNDVTVDWPQFKEHRCNPGEKQLDEWEIQRARPALAAIVRRPDSGEPRRLRA
ncbi:MAG: hypothetical protein H0U59_11000 [Gemmatimonadaceae bacterium]|nr:hypothetical protein [Gemmatimonadaceae bacterium]